MSLTDFLKYNDCISWASFPYLKDKVTNAMYTINGSATPYTLSNSTKALYFNGASYIDGFNYTLGPTFTISVWINQTVTPVSSGVSNTIYSCADSDYSSYIRLRILSTNQLVFNCDVSSHAYSQISQLVNNEWYHVVAVHTPTSITLYVNGVFVGTSTGTMGLDQIVDINVGAYTATNGSFFTGYMKNLMIFNDALSLTQVQKLYYYTYIS